MSANCFSFRVPGLRPYIQMEDFRPTDFLGLALQIKIPRVATGLMGLCLK